MAGVKGWAGPDQGKSAPEAKHKDASLMPSTANKTITQLCKPWRETEEMFTKRLQGIAQHINDHHDVEGLLRRIHSRA